jgi:hypothetical protein
MDFYLLSFVGEVELVELIMLTENKSMMRGDGYLLCLYSVSKRIQLGVDQGARFL